MLPSKQRLLGYGRNNRNSENLDAKYEKVLVHDVIDQFDHLSAQQKNDLKQVLNEHTQLFDGSLGVYPHRKFHIDLVPD